MLHAGIDKTIEVISNPSTGLYLLFGLFIYTFVSIKFIFSFGFLNKNKFWMKLYSTLQTILILGAFIRSMFTYGDSLFEAIRMYSTFLNIILLIHLLLAIYISFLRTLEDEEKLL